MNTRVVLPTYNERGNLAKMVEELLFFPNFSVLIVDDHSPDGTGLLADELAQKDSRVAVLHRTKKEGLGRAYLAGFRRALEFGAKQIIQMDADFSHPTRFVPKLLAGLKSHDFVIGSRYIPDGQIQKWNLRRRLLSSLGNRYAKTILGLDINDLTGGFKCWHSYVLEALLKESIVTNGYAFQIEMTFRALRKGYQCQEVPIVFEERTEGSSKMSKSIILEALWRTTELAWKYRKKSCFTRQQNI